MKEWQRTVVLLILLGIAVGFLIWAAHSTDVNFTQTL
jgi:hypothetical protein